MRSFEITGIYFTESLVHLSILLFKFLLEEFIKNLRELKKIS